MNIMNNIKHRVLGIFFVRRGISLTGFSVDDTKLLGYIKKSILMTEEVLDVSYVRNIRINAVLKYPEDEKGLDEDIHAHTATGFERFGDRYIFNARVKVYRRLADESYKQKIEHMANDLQIDLDKIVYAVIIHELMHVYIRKLWLVSSGIKAWKMDYETMCKMANDDRFYKFQDEICETVIKAMHCTRDDIEREVNAYAVCDEDLHYTEFLAECLTEYILSNHPRRMAVGIFQEIQRIVQNLQWK